MTTNYHAGESAVNLLHREKANNFVAESLSGKVL
jgi:hypothetical protein